MRRATDWSRNRRSRPVSHGTVPRLYISDDGKDKVFQRNIGADGIIGTADDSLSTLFGTAAFGSNDPEGLAYDASSATMWLAGGDSGKLFHIERGPNGSFNGVPPWGTM